MVGVSKNIFNLFASEIPIGNFNICIHGSLLETRGVGGSGKLKFESIAILGRPHWLLSLWRKWMGNTNTKNTNIDMNMNEYL